MLNSNFYKLLSRSSEIDEICCPLKKKFGVTYFNYVKLYRGNNRITLTNRPEYISHFYENSLYTMQNVIDIEKLKYNEFFTWDTFKNELTFAEARQFYSIANGITIIKPSNHYVELYYFGTLPSNPGCLIYQSNIDLFERFILYFKSIAHNLLIDAEKYQFSSNGMKNQINAYDTSIYKFIPTLRFFHKNRFSFYENNIISYLSERETQCVAYQLLQFTTNEIASELNLSSRTIETHVKNIRNKLKCSTKQELIKKISTMRLVDITSNKAVNFYNYPIINYSIAENYLHETHVTKLYLSNQGYDFYLTAAEAKIILFLCHGYGAKEIAKKVNSSYRTVETHIMNIHKKFQINKRSSLVCHMVGNRILDNIMSMYPEYIGKL